MVRHRRWPNRSSRRGRDEVRKDVCARARSAARYQSISRRSLKNFPVGPFEGSVASQTIVSAPSSTDRGAPRPPIRVRTQPGFTQLTSTPLPLVDAASWIVSAFSAAFEIEYAGAYVVIDDSWPAPDETLTMRPYDRAI